MGTITNPRAIYGLLATGTPTKTNVRNDEEIGVASTTLNLTGATKAYCVSATLATIADTLTVSVLTGTATIGTTPVPQVETATVIAGAGATSNGNLAVTVTAARITGSPLAITVPLTTATHTTATLIAGAIRTAMNATAALASVYTVSGTGANITLTETSAENNDATLNIAIAAGLGVSAITSSTNTTAGVGGVKLTNNTGDGNDFEGVAIGTCSEIVAIMVKCISGATTSIESFGNYEWVLQSGGIALIADAAGLSGFDEITITADADSTEVEITIIAV